MKKITDISKKQVSFFQKILSFLPFFIMIWIIFFFSQQNGDTSGGYSNYISIGIIKKINSLFTLQWNNHQIEDFAALIEFGVRKAAHITEYLILTLFFALPLSNFNLKKTYFYFISFFVCVCLSSFDEFHQTFIPGRTGHLPDVFIDSIGIVFALLTYAFISTLRFKKMKKLQKP